MKRFNYFKAVVATIVLSSIFGLRTYSQDMTMDDVKLVQQAFGRDKKVLLGQYIKLSEAETAKFWPIYDAYEEERRKLGQTRIMIIEDYAKHYESLTDAKADELIKKVMKNDDDYSKLQKKYYESVKKATSPLKAAQFVQFENYIQTSIRSAIQEEIPFISEIKKQSPPKS